MHTHLSRGLCICLCNYFTVIGFSTVGYFRQLGFTNGCENINSCKLTGTIANLKCCFKFMWLIHTNSKFIPYCVFTFHLIHPHQKKKHTKGKTFTQTPENNRLPKSEIVFRDRPRSCAIEDCKLVLVLHHHVKPPVGPWREIGSSSWESKQPPPKGPPPPPRNSRPY